MLRLLLLVLFLGSSAGASAQSVGAEVRPLLRRGTSKAEVLESWSPPRLRALNRRVQHAILSNKDWWRDQLAHTKPGEVVPYDPKLGLTPAEYGEFIRLAQDSVLMKPVRTVDVVIESVPSGWRFGKSNAVEGLRGVEIDTLKNQVHSEFGDLTAADPIKAGPNQRTTGPWGGPCWKVNSLTEAGTGSVGKFAIGKLVGTGRTVIYLDARRMEKGRIEARENLFLRMLPVAAGKAP